MPEITTTALPVSPGRVVGSHLWSLLRGRRAAVVGLMVLFLVQAALTLVFPMVIGSFVDAVVAADGGGLPDHFWGLVALLGASAVGAGILAWLGALLLARLAETLIAELREEYVTAALHLPRATVEQAGTGDIVTRASDDIAEISGTLPQVLPEVSVSAFTLVLVAAGLGSLNPWFLLGFAIIVPLYALTVRWYLRIAPVVYGEHRASESRRGQHILGTLMNLPTVTSHRLENVQLDNIRDATWQTVRWAMRARIVQNRLFGRLNIAQLLGLLAVLAIGVWLAVRGEATPGQVSAAALLFLSTVAPLEALLFVMDDLQSALASLGRLVGVIRTPSEEAPVPAGDDGRLVHADQVTFGYRPDHVVLDEVSVHIEAGETVAVVGATGSGKSTLAALLAGIHQPTGGTVHRAVELTDIVTITQETHVFAGTLRANLTMARPDATDPEVLDALSRVGAEGVVASLPDGLETRVGHGERNLTAAAAQQIALARLLLADPPFAILDEATADTDSADAGLLDSAATAAVSGRAALVVAHRLSQAKACDRILVVADGRVIEDGTHDELVAADGSYAELWTAWSAGSDGR